MKRKSADQRFDVTSVPDNLLRFRLADWADDSDAMPGDFGFGQTMWREVRAHARWRDARHEWLAGRGLLDANGRLPRELVRVLREERSRRWPVVDADA